jgi:hypothetical protein
MSWLPWEIWNCSGLPSISRLSRAANTGPTPSYNSRLVVLPQIVLAAAIPCFLSSNRRDSDVNRLSS